MKKDHIALPCSSLKRFREPNEKNFFYIDLSNNEIHEKGPSTYQKSSGYYETEFDDLCQRIETQIGNIYKEADVMYESRGGFFYTSEQLKSIAIDIMALQTARRPELFENATNPDEMLDRTNELVGKYAKAGILTPRLAFMANKLRGIFTTTKKRRDFFYKISFEEMKKILIDVGQLQSYLATIHAIPNDIQATYLLTPYHYFIYKDCYIITLSPRYAIVLTLKTAYTVLTHGDGKAILVADEDNVLRLIPAAIEATCLCEHKHLIGEKYMLIKVQEHLQLNCEKLNINKYY